MGEKMDMRGLWREVVVSCLDWYLAAMLLIMVLNGRSGLSLFWLFSSGTAWSGLEHSLLASSSHFLLTDLPCSLDRGDREGEEDTLL